MDGKRKAILCQEKFFIFFLGLTLQLRPQVHRFFYVTFETH